MLAVAAIDLGSNAIRLVIVRLGPSGAIIETQTRRYALRIGADVFARNHIGPECQAQLLEVFDDCAKRMRELHVRRYRAVATSAMRDAANAAAVIALVHERTGVAIEIISGVEEGRLMRLTLRRALGSVPPDSLFVDLGGGSMEIERAQGTHGRSLPFGTVRLLHRHPALCGPLSPAALDSVAATIEDELRAALHRPRSASTGIGTGGNLDALSRLAPAAAMAVPAIDLARLAPLRYELARLSHAEIAERYQLREDRADVILPATLVVAALAEIFTMRVLLVPGTGIRDAVLRSLVVEETALARASHVVRRSRRDRGLALARQLFELLANVHQIWPPGLHVLEAAYEHLPTAALANSVHVEPEALGAASADAVQQLALETAVLAMSRVATPAPDLGVPPHSSAVPDGGAVRTLAAILRLALALRERAAAVPLRVNLLTDPIVITAGLKKPLPRGALPPLCSALGRRIRVV